MSKSEFLSRIEGQIDISVMPGTQQANKWFLMFGETAIFSSTGDLMTGTVIGLFNIHTTNPPTTVQFKRDGTRVDEISDSTGANALSQLQYTGAPPSEVDDLCSFISNAGGKNNIAAAPVTDTILGYKNVKDLGFTVKSSDITGLILYYKKQYSSGDAITGC